jgi:hypothetical protein
VPPCGLTVAGVQAGRRAEGLGNRPTSVSWNTKYVARVTSLAPILTSFSRKVVRVQLRIDHGSANCRSEFARFYASFGRWSARAI